MSLARSFLRYAFAARGDGLIDRDTEAVRFARPWRTRISSSDPGTGKSPGNRIQHGAPAGTSADSNHEQAGPDEPGRPQAAAAAAHPSGSSAEAAPPTREEKPPPKAGGNFVGRNCQRRARGSAQSSREGEAPKRDAARHALRRASHSKRWATAERKPRAPWRSGCLTAAAPPQQQQARRAGARAAGHRAEGRQRTCASAVACAVGRL